MKILTEIPEEVNKSSVGFLEWLGDTTMLKTSKNPSNVIISCLVHGMEPSGYYAIQKFLREVKNGNIKLKKTISFLFVNVKAALEKPYFTKRYLKGQNDMNRIWMDSGISERQNYKVLKLKEFILNEKPNLLIDFHNTSASNPPFIVSPTNSLNTIKLASTLVDNVIQIEWLGTLSKFASMYCDSFVVECGKYNSKESHEKAYEFLNKIMIYEGVIDGELILGNEILLSKETRKLEIPDFATFDFSKENTDADVVLLPDIETYNFKELEQGTFLGWENKQGIINSDFLEVKEGVIRTNGKKFMFSMLTNNLDIIKGDTMGYTAVFQKIKF